MKQVSREPHTQHNAIHTILRTHPIPSISSTLSILLFLIVILFPGCALLPKKDTPKKCPGWIEGDVYYKDTPTVRQLWDMSLDVFQTPYDGYLARFPHYCDAIQRSPINCSYQATIQHGKAKHFVSSHLMGIRIYKHADYAYKHAIFFVLIDGHVWLFDRNYGGQYPRMPMPEDGYLGMYTGKMELDSIRNIKNDWEWYQPFPLPDNK